MEQVDEPVKDEREQHVLAIGFRIMPGVSPVASISQSQHQSFPTPSPFSFSVASTRWSSRPLIHRHFYLFLRFSVLLFSFISALTLVTPSTNNKHHPSPSFTDYSELIYCFVVAIIALVYTAFQLFKGISDIAHRGILISDLTSDYLSFVLDQASPLAVLLVYLLVSSASVAVPTIGQVERGTALRKGTIVSTSMAFATFLVMAICAILSGYKLCKRIGW
ncbi:hypothetical protein Goklo_009412 [Gossypium klotzschianum]|uniref:CASP-like protein n=1 Tax=Gossypium klotzschianum TaxID=34286 RepID=A0A7J8V3T1_9ROSI|nr:hypothetical protein [Gossypium klotzschianum]